MTRVGHVTLSPSSVRLIDPSIRLMDAKPYGSLASQRQRYLANFAASLRKISGYERARLASTEARMPLSSTSFARF